MPAMKINYMVSYEGCPQIYGAGKKDIAMSSPPPPGYTMEQKKVWFITQEPDTGLIVKHEIPKEEVMNAELKEAKPR